jgi:ubiquinone/menaquinone biosynthesis C-methylase UbiE
MFRELADYYDLWLADKDYRGEARRMVSLARHYGRRGATRWLDVACGTGRHLEFLRQQYKVTGLDASSEMLRIAHRRLPGVRLVRADMRTFRLDERFDVISCVFSAIAHLRSESELRALLSTFARHLHEGGVAIIEPWIDPAEFRTGFVHLMAHEAPGVTVVRMSFSSRRGNRSILRIHYLVGSSSTGVRHFQETDVGLLVPRIRMLQLFREAGLRPRYIRRGIRPGRGVYVATRH